MSAPLRMDAYQLRKVADALDGLSELTQKTGVNFAAYGTIDIEISGAVIRVEKRGEGTDAVYIIDDYVGN